MLCVACNLMPEHPSLTDARGICIDCQQFEKSGFIERIATNQMPTCFAPTRESYVRAASYILLLRAILKVTATELANIAGTEPYTYDCQQSEMIVAAAKKLFTEGIPMSGLNPSIFGIDVPAVEPCEHRDFYETVFGAKVSVVMPIEKQRNGEWAILVVFLNDAQRSGSGRSPGTLRCGDLAIVRDGWLRHLPDC